MPPSSHQSTMHSLGATTPTSNPSITAAATPAQSHQQHEHGNAPHCPSTQAPAPTNDFYLDTFFNPVWMSGPNVFSFNEHGTVVRPETYTLEPYPGYHANRPRPVDQHVESVSATYSQGFARKDPKPWKNVAITEQDDAEFEEFQERMRLGALGEHRGRLPYVHEQFPVYGEETYTWPPQPRGW
ncbi:hypothetical protein JVT61DRAFT_8510 [Boletus reticuloceps]|uniref:Uncharacterized protein n=1 Tax=Boletus reticuloceps TaxID=495285 RepID=A0A8I2Z171_9AGAM|nr:hypothetical protein JVT61DRAFT_8510 [Boletus reticuloceps]